MVIVILKNNSVIKTDGFDVDQVFGATKKQLRQFWERYCFRYCILEHARKYAKEVLTKLRRDGNKIFIITGRMLSYEKNFLGFFMRTSVKFWLKKNGIRYDRIIFCPEHDLKIEMCQYIGIEVMIEDKPQNIMTLSKIMKVICFDCGYNRDCEGGR